MNHLEVIGCVLVGDEGRVIFVKRVEGSYYHLELIVLRDFEHAFAFWLEHRRHWVAGSTWKQKAALGILRNFLLIKASKYFSEDAAKRPYISGLAVVFLVENDFWGAIESTDDHWALFSLCFSPELLGGSLLVSN